MIDGLLGGRLFAKPIQRASASGKSYVVCKVIATDAENASHFVSVVTFNEGAMDTLLALDQGDTVTMSGELKISLWSPPAGGEPRLNVGLTCHSLITTYHVQRKRQSVATKPTRGQGMGAFVSTWDEQAYRQSIAPLSE